jgi:hypothetical protein
MGLADLSSILLREREVLELLLFKLEQRQHLLTSGRTRWLAYATREVDLLEQQLRCVEVLRAAEVESVATRLGPRAGRTLARLVDAGPDAWSPVLAECGDDLRSLCAEIAVIVRTGALGPASRDRAASARPRLTGSLDRAGARHANGPPALASLGGGPVAATSTAPPAPVRGAVPRSLLDFLA